MCSIFVSKYFDGQNYTFDSVQPGHGSLALFFSILGTRLPAGTPPPMETNSWGGGGGCTLTFSLWVLEEQV